MPSRCVNAALLAALSVFWYCLPVCSLAEDKSQQTCQIIGMCLDSWAHEIADKLCLASTEAQLQHITSISQQARECQNTLSLRDEIKTALQLCIFQAS